MKEKILIISFLFLLILSSCIRKEKKELEKEKIPEVSIPSQVEEEIKQEMVKEEIVPEERIPEEKIPEKKIPEEKPAEPEKPEKQEEEIVPEEKSKEEIALLPKEKITSLPEEKIEKKEILPLYLEKWNGECLIYDVKWNFVSFGKVIVICKEERNSYGKVYHLIGITIPEGLPAKLGYGYNRLDSFVDIKTGKPYYFYFYTKSGKSEKITEIFFSHRQKQYKAISKKFKNGKLYSTKNEIINFDKEIFDCLSIFYFIRNSQIPDLKDKEFQIALSEIWYLKINFKGTYEKEFDIFGKKQVFLIEPKARSKKENFDKGRLNIYITNDEARLPIYLEGRVPAGKANLSILKVKKIEPSLNLDRNKIWELLKE